MSRTQVVAAYLLAVLHVVTVHANHTIPADACTANYNMFTDTDLVGVNINPQTLASPDPTLHWGLTSTSFSIPLINATTCCAFCLSYEASCRGFVAFSNNCYLKTAASTSMNISSQGRVAYIRTVNSPPPSTLPPPPSSLSPSTLSPPPPSLYPPPSLLVFENSPSPSQLPVANEDFGLMLWSLLIIFLFIFLALWCCSSFGCSLCGYSWKTSSISSSSIDAQYNTGAQSYLPAAFLYPR